MCNFIHKFLKAIENLRSVENGFSVRQSYPEFKELASSTQLAFQTQFYVAVNWIATILTSRIMFNLDGILSCYRTEVKTKRRKLTSNQIHYAGRRINFTKRWKSKSVNNRTVTNFFLAYGSLTLQPCDYIRKIEIFTTLFGSISFSSADITAD